MGTVTPSTVAVACPNLPPKPTSTPSGAGAHQGQRGGVGGTAAHDHRHVELVHELLQVERLRLPGHVLGGHRGAADHEDVHARVDDRLGVPHGLLRTARAAVVTPAERISSIRWPISSSLMGLW